MIESPANEKVKYARSLLQHRRRLAEGRCLVEGVRLIEDVLQAGAIPALVFHVPQVLEGRRARALVERLHGLAVTVLEVSPPVLDTLSDTVTPQGIVAVVPLPEAGTQGAATLVLVLDALRDPGNLGTVLRTAWATGVERVLLAPGTVDPYNSKALRGAMGAQFHLPPEPLAWPQIGAAVAGMAVWLAAADGETAYDAVDWRQACALIVGGEAAGVGGEARQLATGRVCIPMRPGAESLNAAVSTGVLLCEAQRQRRAGNVSHETSAHA